MFSEKNIVACALASKFRFSDGIYTVILKKSSIQNELISKQFIQDGGSKS